MINKTSKEDAISYLESFGYKLLSEYKNISSRIIISCPNGHVYETTFNAFKNKNRRCRECKKLEKENFIKEYIKKENYKLIDMKIKNNNLYVYVQCHHNHDPYWVVFSSFKTLNRRCRVCGFEKTKQSTSHSYDYVKNYIESIEYTLLSNEYENTIEKLNIKCDKGHIFKMGFKQIKRGDRCPKCMAKKNGEKQRLSYNEVKDYINKYGYTLLSKEYRNAQAKIKVMCPEGHIYYVRFNNFKTGYRCPICHASSGESETRRVLESLKIDFKQQYIFKDCKFKSYLPFDFYLPDYNTLIEYDGGQHYKIVEHFGGFDAFVKLKIRDTIKNIYCKDNNINLIRIPYWEFNNIENIIVGKINKL